MVAPPPPEKRNRMRGIVVGALVAVAVVVSAQAIQTEIHRHRLIRKHHHCLGGNGVSDCMRAASSGLLDGMSGANSGSTFEFQSLDFSDESGPVDKFTATRKGDPVTWREALALWTSDDDFTDHFTDLLMASRFKAFFFECPPLTPAALDSPFEFILRESAQLARITRPDSGTFDEHLENSISAFPNLGGDAILVAPKQDPASKELAYAHLANFVRDAPPDQVRSLWARVGEAMQQRVASEGKAGRPVWLSTSGLGVFWLHIRLDRTPKYYTFKPYRSAPAQNLT